MKSHNLKTALLSALAICSMTFTSYAGKNTAKAGNKSSHCLELSGKVDDGDSKSQSVFKVLLVNNNKVVDSMEVVDNGGFAFTLRKNTHYTVKISSPGFISRSISVNTDLPDDADTKVLFKFHFDTVLSKITKSDLNDDIFDFPIALIAFDELKGYFNYSKKYTSIVKKELSVAMAH